MGLTTDFNLYPYYDDFEVVGTDGLTPSEKYYRVMFKPAVAVQARELTQLQSILQKQVERFGDNILKEGTIVTGGNFVEMSPLPYVKLLDIGTDADGNQISIDTTAYVGMKAVGKTTGLEAIIVAVAYGLETLSPELQTIYVRYINNAQDGSGNNISTFSTTEEIEIQQLDNNSIWQKYQTVTAAGTIESTAAIGNGYGVRCGEGVIYQKGFFISFKDAVTVVSRYDTAPDGVVVGFQTSETLINSNQDTSLLDNASGFNNYNAPGADRLKLSPALVVKTLAEANADETFFSLQEYQSGRVVRRRLTTQFNSVEKFAERRTYDESGDYVVNDFTVRVDQSTSNTSNLSVSIGKGIAYVQGKRVELVNNFNIEIPESNTSTSITGQDIIANYANYVVVDGATITGVFPIGTFPLVNLKISSVVSGTARLRDVELQTDGDYRLYLFDIKMNSGANWSNVDTIDYNSGAANAALVSNNIEGISFKQAIYPIGRNFISSVDYANTNYIYRKVDTSSAVQTDATVVLTLSGADTFPYSLGALNPDQLKEIVLVSTQTQSPYSAGDYLTVTAANVTTTKTMTVTISSAPAAAMNVTAFINAKKSNQAFNVKTLKNVYVKIDAATHSANTTGEYTLGLPDVYDIVGIWQGSTYSESNTDVLAQFNLVNNQKDTHYGLSRIKKVKSHTIGASDKLLIKVRVFEKTSGSTFFTFDSYANSIDDVTTPLPADKIRTENVPTYTSEDGTLYYLRDVLDFRPFANATAAYSLTAGSATINPSETVAFSTVNFISPNKSVEFNYDYYQGRIDRLVIDENGNFEVIRGAASDNPTVPPEPTKSMSLATFSIPPYPSLPMSLANAAGKSDYGITVTRFKNRRYTMKDIGQLDTRLRNLEYYTSLSLLEKNAKDLLIVDASGNNRFKNGILVDNFENLSIAELNNSEYAAGIDPAYKELTPKFRAYPINLKPVAVSNVTDFGEAASLTKSDVSVINQPYATSAKSCTTDYYKYNGAMLLDPAYDTGPDTSIAPDINFDIDLATPFAEYTEALSEYVPLTSVTTEVVSSTSSRSGGLFGRRSTTTTLLETTSTLTVGEDVTSQNLGDFVTNAEFNPYMRGRNVNVSVTGLRPSTRFYFFFDGIDVNVHVAPATVLDGAVTRSADWGENVLSDSNGVLNAVFRIPDGTFFVGDRTLELIDVSQYSSKDSSTSYASRVYSGFNFAVEKSGLSVTTRNPVITNQITTREITNSSSRGSDPIAQTFAIDSENSSDNSVMVTKLDVYFASKSSVGNGCSFQIRETVNGYPGTTSVPFSDVHLEASQINANSSNASTATEVVFDAPVALKTNTEYCIVIAPDANDPDYRVWISRTGENDVDSGIAIVQDTNAGVLFTSTNNKTWSPYQTENLKFNLYKAAFNVASGYVTMTHRDYEFFALDTISTQFKQGETVIRSASNFTGTIAVTAGNTTISGTSTLFDAELNVGDQLVYKPTASTYEVLTISAINSNTEIVVSNIPFVSNSAANFFSSPVGEVVYFTTIDPAVMILENSTAKTDFYFADGDTLIGVDSGATANLTTVMDQPMSYIQPGIARSNFMTTRTTLSATKLWNGAALTTAELEFNDNNYLISETAYIRSRSNEYATYSGANTFELKVLLESTSTSTKDTSPLIDHMNSNVTVFGFMVNNDDTDETTNEGDATSKYISKKVVLADGLDAEDLRVFITGYRPPATNIEVYAKFQNSTDSRAWEEIEWTKLVLKSETDFTSAASDRFDYKEFEFYVGNTVPSPEAGGGAYLLNDTLHYVSSDSSVYDTYKIFAIKVLLLADGHNQVPRLKDMRAIAAS